MSSKEDVHKVSLYNGHSGKPASKSKPTCRVAASHELVQPHPLTTAEHQGCPWNEG